MAALATSLPALATDFEVLVHDRDGNPLSDAVVVLYAIGRPTPAPPAPPDSPWIISQEHMKFHPAVTVTVPGASLQFTNLDRYDHHVRGALLQPGIAVFDNSATHAFEMYLNGRKDGKDPTAMTQRVDKPGVYLLGCHLHGSMRGHIFVTDSAWTLKSDANGRVRFDNLMPGGYKVRIWHPGLILEGPPEEVKLTEGIITQAYKLEVSARRGRF